MANQQLLPAWLGRLHSSRVTPRSAVTAVFLISAALALTGTLRFLSGATSAFILSVFLAVNLSLVALRPGEHEPAEGQFRIPLAIPVIAVFLSLGLLGFVPAESMLRAGALAAVGLGLVLFRLLRH